MANPTTAVIDAGGVGYKLTISENTYNSLEAALAQAVDGDTLTLIQDIELTNGVTFASADASRLTLDLDGHTLCVAGLDGDGTITSSFDLTVPELARATTSTTLIRNTVPGNLFTNNFEWAQDAVHRLIC